MANTQALNKHSNSDNPSHILEEYSDLVGTLRHLAQHPFVATQQMEFDYDSCEDVCNKLSYLLPISNQARQSLLEMDTLDQRMLALRSALSQLQA